MKKVNLEQIYHLEATYDAYMMLAKALGMDGIDNKHYIIRANKVLTRIQKYHKLYEEDKTVEIDMEQIAKFVA